MDGNTFAAVHGRDSAIFRPKETGDQVKGPKTPRVSVHPTQRETRESLAKVLESAVTLLRLTTCANCGGQLADEPKAGLCEDILHAEAFERIGDFQKVLDQL